MEGFLMNRLGEWAPQTMVLMGEKGGAGSTGSCASGTGRLLQLEIGRSAARIAETMTGRRGAHCAA